MDTPARSMITFKEGNIKFTYRIGGIAFHNNAVLFQNATNNVIRPFYFLPGGRAELSEQATETLYREMHEELGASITIERLLFVVENFFSDPYPRHELGLYFLMSFSPDSYLYREAGPFVRSEAGNPGLPLIFNWLPLDQLVQLPVQPAFLRTALQHVPEGITHIVNTDK